LTPNEPLTISSRIVGMLVGFYVLRNGAS